VGRIALHAGTYRFQSVTGVGIGVGAYTSGGDHVSLRQLIFKNPSVAIVTEHVGTGVGQHRIDRLAISAGTFQLPGLDGASGLGSGASRSGVPGSIGELLIRGSDFAISAVDAVVIGAGVANNADSTGEQLVIENGIFRLKLSGSTGIGSSSSIFGTSSVHNLTILDGDRDGKNLLVFLSLGISRLRTATF
jgi:hypothetical protein